MDVFSIIQLGQGKISDSGNSAIANKSFILLAQEQSFF